VQPYGADRELLPWEQVGLIAPERLRAELIEATTAMVAFTRTERV
jgi:hypothetical protein